MYLAHMCCNTPRGSATCNVPQKDRTIPTGRREFGIILGAFKDLRDIPRKAERMLDIHCDREYFISMRSECFDFSS